MSSSIFVSCSGPLAGDVAQLLKTLVEDSLGTGDVFISKEIEGGARWSHEIPRQLDECADGLVVVTAEKHLAPWLHFEAGAISKHVEASHVTPLLFDAEGLAGGKKVIVALARGGLYAKGTPQRGIEHSERYLTDALAFIGITDPQFVIAEGLALGDEARSALEAAHRAVRDIGAACPVG